jgi:hypothetical protein
MGSADRSPVVVVTTFLVDLFALFSQALIEV